MALWQLGSSADYCPSCWACCSSFLHFSSCALGGRVASQHLRRSAVWMVLVRSRKHELKRAEMVAFSSKHFGAPPNKRLKLAGARRLWNESFFSAPQLKRDPLGST